MMLVRVVLLFSYFFSVSSSIPPPKTWKENWFEHTQLLTRQYYDDDVAIYFDPDVDKSITWVSPFYHDLWMYVKKVYGKFGDDPRLYGVFHTEKYNGCHFTSYFDRQKQYRNVVDCGLLASDAWKNGTYEEHRLIIYTLAWIVHSASKGVDGWPVWDISISNLNSIITYDIYLGLNRTKNAQKFRDEYINANHDVRGKKVYLFRDWFLPIYEKYGGSTALNRFLELAAENLPKSNTSSFNRPKYERDMTYGEFFHFWSAATGRNLKSLASEVFEWKERFEEEFEQARTQFPKLSKYYKRPETWQENWFEHEQLVTIQYTDDEVAVYFDKDVDKSINWMNKVVGEIWVHVKKVYGEFGEDPLLYAIFHSGKYGGCHGTTYLESLKSYRNVIDCGTTKSGGWWAESPQLMDQIVIAFAKLPQNAAHGITYNAAFDIWGWNFDNIFIYDAYLGINRTDLANRYYDQQLVKFTSSPKPRTYWFKDWFVPIYEEYGGSEVLGGFFKLLAKYFPRNVDENKKQKYTRNMNHGEFVYFWSGAAGNSLKGLATEAFGWNEEYEKEYQQAKKDFPDIRFYNIIL